MEEWVFHFAECYRNLQTISSIQRNITKDYPIAKPLKYLTTRSHRPLPQKGDPTFSAPEQASYCWVFGCSCMVFLSDGLSMSARETIFDRTAPGNHGVTWSSRSKLDSWWESITCERYGRLQVRRGHWTSTSKCRCGKIRYPHGCSYQDRALIYCKQSVIPVPWCINHMAYSMKQHWCGPATRGNRVHTYSKAYIMLGEIMNLLSSSAPLSSRPHHSSADI